MDLLETGFMTRHDAAAVRNGLRARIRGLRPELVALVDAFEFTDYQLNDSAIGAYDGDVYRRLVDIALTEPLNNSPDGKVVGYEDYLQPIIKGKVVARPSRL